MYEIERKILCTLRYRELYIVVLWCLTQKALLILQILYYIRVYLKFFPRTKLMALIMQNFKKKWKYYELLFKPRNIQINRLKKIAHLTPPPLPYSCDHQFEVKIKKYHYYTLKEISFYFTISHQSSFGGIFFFICFIRVQKIMF